MIKTTKQTPFDLFATQDRNLSENVEFFKFLN